MLRTRYLYLLAAGVVAAALGGCSKAPLVPVTTTSAFAGSWSGTWDAKWERGTTTFAVAPDGTFNGTMHSTVIGRTWPFWGSFNSGAFTGNVKDSPKDTYILGGTAAVYGSSELKATGKINLHGKPMGVCVFELKQ